MKEIYEIFSLLVGASAITTIISFIGFDGLQHCIIIMEPKWYIRIPEIITGLIALPYYFKKIYWRKK